jgi:ABC-type nitrate/sulfonate/bicarbonate transport system permease component
VIERLGDPGLSRGAGGVTSSLKGEVLSELKPATELERPTRRWDSSPPRPVVAERDPPSRWLRAVPAALVLGGLIAWELAVRAGAISALFYPAPTTIGRTIGELAREGVLTSNLGISLTRMGLGFAWGGGLGLLVGLGIGWSRRLHAVLDPLVAAAHPVPRLALLPLILLVFGIGETSRILIISLSCFFPMVINAAAGVRQIETIHFEVARSFGARPHQILAFVVLPGSLPAVAAGARLALVSSLRTTLGIELITSEQGLGFLVWSAWETFRPDVLYAALVVIALLGIGMNVALKRLVLLAQPGRRVAAP